MKARRQVEWSIMLAGAAPRKAKFDDFHFISLK